MIFESMWPLGLLAAVPVVVLLYLLKPRGKDYRISSNLLWDKLFQNQQSYPQCLNVPADPDSDAACAGPYVSLHQQTGEQRWKYGSGAGHQREHAA